MFSTDVRQYFKRVPGSERIEVLCGLLQLCSPLELRFIGSCVEDLAKKDYIHLRELENESNDQYQLRTCSDPDIFDERTRSRLNISISLLYSLNTVCAHVLFEVLSQIEHQIIRDQECPDSRLLDPQIAEDVVLLFTMAANHPAFTFRERHDLYLMFKNVEKLVGAYLIKVS